MYAYVTCIRNRAYGLTRDTEADAPAPQRQNKERAREKEKYTDLTTKTLVRGGFFIVIIRTTYIFFLRANFDRGVSLTKNVLASKTFRLPRGTHDIGCSSKKKGTPNKLFPWQMALVGHGFVRVNLPRVCKGWKRGFSSQ